MFQKHEQICNKIHFNQNQFHNTLHLKSHINQRLTKNVDQVRGKNKEICGNNETFPMKNQSFLVPNSQHLSNELSAIFLASMSSRGKNGYSSLFTIS
ncbi:hypothetical protein QL285_083540 [Trifolium repens]|nr:hypothetical protein QL285_083540 [Trifolium repens]